MLRREFLQWIAMLLPSVGSVPSIRMPSAIENKLIAHACLGLFTGFTGRVAKWERLPASFKRRLREECGSRLSKNKFRYFQGNSIELMVEEDIELGQVVSLNGWLVGVSLAAGMPISQDGQSRD